jgi:PAS domain S-box-containing protein
VPESRILIVEDEALVATHLKRILTKSGYDVVGMIASGEEALQLVEETPPDLVLMDINLAGELDGIETTTQIHERFDIPVVYLTGYAEEMVVQQAKVTEPFGYVAKPIRERELCATIEMALYRHQMETQLKENETRFRALSDATFEGIAFTEQSVIVDANQQFADMFGYKVDQVQGLDVRQLVTPEDRELVQSRILAGSEEPYEHRGLRKDGTVIFVEVRPRMMSIKERSLRVTAVRNITERKQVERQIEASLREKEVLLQEIHHRVKNNFAVMRSLLDIQADYVQDEQSRKVFRDSQHRLRTMALIHEQLYSIPDLAQIDFTDYVYTLTTDLFTTYRVDLAHPIEPKLNVHDVFLDIKQAIPCGMIINELVSNALKYAFPATGDWPSDFVGEVCVTFHSIAEGKYELVVSDNGVGLPADVRLPSKDTLGLFLIDRFVQQLGGTVEWQGDGGTTCRIMFARQ